MCQLIPGQKAVGAEIVMKPQAEVAPSDKKGRSVLIRLGALAALSIVLYFIGQALGFGELQSFSALQELVNSAGIWGRVAYLAVFMLVCHMQLPAAVFIVGALLLWGPAVGGALGWTGAMLALATHFAVTRSVGGAPLQSIQNPRVRQLLDKLESHPVPVIAGVRLFMLMSPPINIALILAGVRFRDYMLGSAIGLGVVILAAALGFDMIEPWLRGILG